LSAAQTLAAVSSSTNAVLWTGPAYGAQILDVGVSAAGTSLTALGANSRLYFVDPTSHAPIDSLDLPAPPVKMVETSTGTRALVAMNNFNIVIVDIPSRQIVSTVAVAGTMNVFKMGPGDTVAYAAMALGNIVEINTSTGAVKRQFQPTAAPVQDLSISRDGKTMYLVDGSGVVTIVALAAGGRTGTADFGAGSLASVAISPDDRTLYVTQGNTLIKADFSNGDWVTGLVENRVTVSGTTLKGLAISATGNVIFAIDDGGNQVVIFK
jgi:sugar lactone lactonase YvrE